MFAELRKYWTEEQIVEIVGAFSPPGGALPVTAECNRKTDEVAP
jgi:hypothetical protein